MSSATIIQQNILCFYVKHSQKARLWIQVLMKSKVYGNPVLYFHMVWCFHTGKINVWCDFIEREYYKRWQSTIFEVGKKPTFDSSFLIVNRKNKRDFSSLLFTFHCVTAKALLSSFLMEQTLFDQTTVYLSRLTYKKNESAWQNQKCVPPMVSHRKNAIINTQRLTN